MAGEPALLSGRRKAGPAALPRVLPPYGLGPTGGARTGKGHTGSGDHSAVHRPHNGADGRAAYGRRYGKAQQHQYQLRNMLVRELRTMPERGDPDEL